jgi:hypothetical protein
MDIVKRLKAKPPKGFVTSPLMIEAATEIERLRQQNAELVDALRNALKAHGVGQLIGSGGNGSWITKAQATIAKATGGE